MFINISEFVSVSPKKSYLTMNMIRRSRSRQIISDENGDALYRPEIARGFRNIRNSEIVLQDARVTHKYLKCLLQVRNRTFEKVVWAKLIFDVWESYCDVQASWRKSDSELVDIYEFITDWPEASQEVKFTLCCHQDNKKQWDTGPYGNYVFIRPPKHPLDMILLSCVRDSFSGRSHFDKHSDSRSGKDQTYDKGTQTTIEAGGEYEKENLSVILHGEKEDARTNMFTSNSAYMTCIEMAHTLGAKEFFEIAKDVCIKLETEESGFDQQQQRSVKKNFNFFSVGLELLPISMVSIKNIFKCSRILRYIFDHVLCLNGNFHVCIWAKIIHGVTKSIEICKQYRTKTF